MMNSAKALKILFVHHGSVPGGAPTSLANLIRGLTSISDFDLQVTCAFGRMRRFFEEHTDVSVHWAPRPCKTSGKVFIGYAHLSKWQVIRYFLYELFLLPVILFAEFRLLRNLNPDIVHLNSSILWTMAIAAKLTGKKIVWHVREMLQGSKFNLRRISYAIFLRWMADKVICISPAEQLSIGGAEDPKVSVVYNSIDFSQFSEEYFQPMEERHRFHIPENKFVILNLGGFSFRKGTYQLLQSIRHLGPGYHLVIAGEMAIRNGGDYGIAKKTVHRLENWLVEQKWKSYYSWYYSSRILEELNKIPRSKVSLLGQVKNVAGLVSACEVLVSAGVTPHFSRPVFEAWAMKKPVVAFDTPAMRSEIRHGHDGIIVTEHSGQALAAAIAELKDRPGYARHLGENGHHNAMKKFDLYRNARSVKRLYESI